METKRFTRNPVEVEAVQVTPTNVAEVAEWCKGTLTEANYRLMGGSHKLPAIQLTKQGPGKDKTRVVMIGSWITKHKNVFKSWTREAFEAVYTEIKPALQAGDLVRTNDKIELLAMVGWEGKIADAHLVGVDFGDRGRVVFEPAWLDKIDEMSSEQLQLNAGVEHDQVGVDPMTAVINEMRQESKDRIAALEKENLEYDDAIRVGDLVKIVKHPQLTQPPVNMGQCGHVRLIEDVPSADGPTKDYWVEFATADPEKPERVPYELVCLEKLRQDGEALNLEWEPPAPVAINDLRENLGMPRVPELEGVAADERAIENHRIITESLAGMTPEEIAKVKADVVELQDVIRKTVASAGEHQVLSGTVEKIVPFVEKSCSKCGKWSWDSKTGSYNEMHQLEEGGPQEPCDFDGPSNADFGPQDPSEVPGRTLSDYAQDDMVETIITYDLDGVKLPAGTTGRVTVVGCDLVGSHEMGVEVLFADGNYGHFLPVELRKI